VLVADQYTEELTEAHHFKNATNDDLLVLFGWLPKKWRAHD